MAHPTDKHVGQKIRERRNALGLTLQALADAIGVRFQQLQKYETGANRISASRMLEAARVLNVPVSFFFAGLEEHTEDRLVARTPSETQLIIAFRYLSPALQWSVVNVVRAAGENAKSMPVSDHAKAG